VTEKSFPPSVGLCIAPYYPLKPAYTFTPLIAESAIKPLGAIEGADRFDMGNADFNRPVVQSPFTENLNIFFPSVTSNSGYKVIRLLTMNGQKIFEQRFESLFDQVAIPADNALPGVYILNIETLNQVYIMKVVKSSY